MPAVVVIASVASLPWAVVGAFMAMGVGKMIARNIKKKREQNFLFHTTIEVPYKVIR